MLGLVNEMTTMCGRNVESSRNSRSLKTVARPGLEQCEANVRSLAGAVLRVLAQWGDDGESSYRSATADGARERVMSEQGMLKKIYDELVKLQQCEVMQAREALSRLQQGMQRLGQMAKDDGGKYSHGGWGPQYNNVSEQGGGVVNVTNNTSGESWGPVYFGQKQTFAKE